MAETIVTATALGYRLPEARRLSLLSFRPPEPLHSAAWLDQELSGIDAAQIGHPEICSGTPRRAMRRILDRDLAALFSSGDLGHVL